MDSIKVEFKDIVLSNIYEIEEIILLLEKKGLLSRAELFYPNNKI